MVQGPSLIFDASIQSLMAVFEVPHELKIANTVEGSIDVSSLSEGVYFIEINSEEGKHIKKFIKD